MSQTLHAGEYRIDRPSQIILGGLNADDWMFGEPLREAADLGQNQQVFYRMDTHLLPAGLVEEKPREDRSPGYEQARQFRLTDHGTEWVDDHAGEIARPATREETQRMVTEARDDAASAKASVQNYRKKLSRMKRHVEDIREDVAEVDRRHAHDYEEMAHLGRVGEKAHNRAHENQRAIEELRGAVDDRATVETVDDLRDDVNTDERALTTLENELNELAQRQADAEQSRARVRQIATWVGMIGIVFYFFVLVGVGVFAPGLLASVVIGGVGGVLGIGVGTAVSASALR